MTSHNTRHNRLFDCLPDADWQRLQPHLKQTEMPLGKVLHVSSEINRFVHFPISCIISLLYVLEDGKSTELAMIGCDGAVDVCMLIGGAAMPGSAVVQKQGMAYRVPTDVITAAFNDSPPLRRLLLRYTQALMTQMCMTAVCNRHHEVEQRLCRWLLVSLDRLPDCELVMTHEMIANMLGVRREGVTEAAVMLQASGLIRYKRGRISVLDREGLEARTCECYKVVKREYDSLLPYQVAA